MRDVHLNKLCASDIMKVLASLFRYAILLRGLGTRWFDELFHMV